MCLEVMAQSPAARKSGPHHLAEQVRLFVQGHAIRKGAVRSIHTSQQHRRPVRPAENSPPQSAPLHHPASAAVQSDHQEPRSATLPSIPAPPSGAHFGAPLPNSCKLSCRMACIKRHQADTTGLTHRLQSNSSGLGRKAVIGYVVLPYRKDCFTSFYDRCRASY
jgi:hypothetical protein